MFKTALQSMVIHHDIDTIGAYETLRKVKEIGYNVFEVSGHFECTDALIEELCRARDDFGMEICALSVAYNGQFPPRKNPFRANFKSLNLVEDFDRAVAYAKRLGCKNLRYAGMPVPNLDTMEKLDEYCELTESLAKRLKEHGINLCMHNHDNEFAKIEGKTYYEWVIEKCPTLCFEFDVLGAAHAAIQLYDCMESVAGRMPLIHIEDIMVKPSENLGPDASLNDRILGCPLGDGNVNVKKFCETAAACGNDYFIIEVSNFRGEDVYVGMKRAADAVRAAGFADTF